MPIVVKADAQAPGAVAEPTVAAVGLPADIVAVATSTSPWNPAVHVAAALAARWGSLLTGCYVDESLRTLRGPESEPSVLGVLLDAPAPDVEEGAEFRAFTRSRGVLHASWTVAHTGLARVLRELGAWHSLAVLERDLVEEEAMAELLAEVLLTCRVPCLVLPPGWAPEGEARFSRVLVAWDGSVEATRAIHAALPFLKDAARVILLDGGRPHSPESECYLPHFEPFVYMVRHGIEAEPVYAGLPSRTAGAGIVERAKRLGADLIVMGAFGHSRVRERVLGGATRHVLGHAPIPIFLQH